MGPVPGTMRRVDAQAAAGAAGRGRKRKDAAADAQLAAEEGKVWWAKTRAAVCGVLRRVARKRARHGRRAGGGGESSGGGHGPGSKRDASAWDACDRSIQHSGDLRTNQGETSTTANKKSKTDGMAYERQYPERTQEQERRGDGPDRPKRKRVDGSVCYANSGEGSKRRCDATGRPPGRPPG